MHPKPHVVIFFNDWPVHPSGVNAGGGESATIALARAIQHQGYPVIACANLPEGDCTHRGIEFWNFGNSYALNEIAKRLRALPSYHCIAATLVMPFLHIQGDTNCLSKILINHSPSVVSSGLEPSTVMRIVDYMLCVSEAQRSIILSRYNDGSRIKVVRNGFDDSVFSYAGPEDRDWNQLVFIGRVEPPKGIHVLLNVFAELKGEFPQLKLAVFGDESFWPDFASQKRALLTKLSGLEFFGKVPQVELAQHLRRAGLLVFPSQSFETAGLAIVDAQASGCPVVATGVGGVPEYLKDGELGQVLYDLNPNVLKGAIANLLRNRRGLIEMSRAAERRGRERPWSVVAGEVMTWAESVVKEGLLLTQNLVTPRQDKLPEVVERISRAQVFSASDVLQAHERLISRDEFSDADLELAIKKSSDSAWPHLVLGIRHEGSGEIDEAISAYLKAAQLSELTDWQPFFRLALIHAERRELPLAGDFAARVLERAPAFPYRNDLQQLIELAKG